MKTFHLDFSVSLYLRWENQGRGRRALSHRLVYACTRVLGSQACPQDLCITKHLSRPSLAQREALPAVVAMFMPPTHFRLIAYSREGLSEGGHEAGRQEFLL